MKKVIIDTWEQTPKANELDNGSVTDTRQWCQLHKGHCPDVVPVRRVFEGTGLYARTETEIFFACQKCIGTLKKAGLMKESKYAGLPCVEIIVPRGLCEGRKVAPDPHKPRRLESLRQRTFEITLDPLQVKYLRALGLQVMKV